MTKRAKDNSANLPHVLVQAGAGTGKTTTMIEGLKNAFQQATKIVPSDQQEAIWNQIGSAKGFSICCVAFNKSIATELQKRVPAGVTACTNHSLGLKSLRQFGKLRVTDYRVGDLIAEVDGRDVRDVRKNDPVFFNATKKLVSLCKMNLVDGENSDEVLALAAHYDVDLNGSSKKVLETVPQVLELCKDVTRDRRVDFDDMIWLPVALDVPCTQFDLLIVDEAQDLNRCQQSLLQKHVSKSGRMMMVGDPNQAIYGFAGADAESMDHMKETLGDSERGVVVLPLNETRRCGKAIVREANKYVEEFYAHKDNPEGEVISADFDDESPKPYRSMVAEGDMILCRVNAPLVSQCFRFIRDGRLATIQGRDIGAGLVSTVKKMKTDDVVDLREKLSDWFDAECKKEHSKKNPSDARLIALQDRYECLCCFVDEATTVKEVIDSIERIFSDKKNGGIKLSSIHRAKGLEADRVFLLQPEGATMPHPMAKSEWQVSQEYNLLYVAITRAINTLVHVS